MAVFTNWDGTNLGPLTTAWSMPDSCKTHVVNCATCAEGFRGQQCVLESGTGKAVDHTTCWPPATARAGTPRAPFLGWGFYSPGLACPTGYTTACTAEYGRRPEWPIAFTLVPGETAVGCCPEGFRCANRNGNTCIAVAATDNTMAVQTAVCFGGTMGNAARATFPDVITTTTTKTSSGAAPSVATQTVTREMTLLAPMFQLNFQSSDLVSESTISTTAAATLPQSQTTSAGSNADSNPASETSSTSSPAKSDQSGLSSGAVAGIGVGAALGGIFLAAVVFWLWRRVRKRRQADALAGPPHYEVEGSQTWAGAAVQKQQLPYDPYQQHSAYGHVPSELGDHSPPVEMPAGSQSMRHSQYA